MNTSSEPPGGPYRASIPHEDEALGGGGGGADPRLHDQAGESQHTSHAQDKMAKIKRKLDSHNHGSSDKRGGTLTTLEEVKDIFEAGSSSLRLDGKDPPQPKSKVNDFFHAPISTARSAFQGQVAKKITDNMAASEISHDHNVKLVESHDRVLQAKSSKERLQATERRDELLKAQKTELVRWTLDRHLTRVRKLSDEPAPCRPRSSFQVKDRQGQPKMDWPSYAEHLAHVYAERYGDEYVGYGLFPPPASQTVITSIVERLLVVSSPLQHLLMQIRAIYRWEDPPTTTLYLLTFLLLWGLDLLLPGLLLAIIVLVLHRGASSPSIEGLRETIHRIENASRRADSFSEFVEKKGSTNWIGPLLEDVGAWFLVEMGDLASFLEVIQNFYAWRYPYYTARSVSMLVLMLAITSATPTWILVRSSTFGMGFLFFALYPISSRRPEFRLLLSPTTWLFWKIPTHAEWAISTIKTQQARNRKIRAQNSTGTEFGRYACKYGHHMGHLILSDENAQFESAVRSNVHLDLPYGSILRMEKVNDIAGSAPGRHLQITTIDEEMYTLHKVTQRDEAFDQILANASFRWLPEW